MVPRAHVPPGVGHRLTLCAHRLGLGAPPADGEPLGVIAFPPDYLWENSSSSINKPVADLKGNQMSNDIEATRSQVLQFWTILDNFRQFH